LPSGPVLAPVLQAPFGGPTMKAFALSIKPMDASATLSTAPETTAAELLFLPRAEVISEAATQAPRASFQMLL